MSNIRNILTSDSDNSTSELRYDNGDIVIAQNVFKDWIPFYKMDAGNRNLTKIKIQWGPSSKWSPNRTV